MSTINFEAEPFTISKTTVVLLPKDASARLPSRGMVMIKGTINTQPFSAALEPDGRGSHWFELDKHLRQRAEAEAGDVVTLEIESTKEWTEPEVPEDIAKALSGDKNAQATWASVTPMARREWIRWIRATNNPDTRQKHIEVACSKLGKGMRRPCCFNARMCTVPEVSKSGMLLQPVAATA